MTLAPWLVAALLVVAGVVVVGRRIARRGAQGRASPALGRIGVLILAGGLLLGSLGFLGMVFVGGPEMRGVDEATGRVFGMMFGLGVLAAVLGVVLGVIALVLGRGSAGR